MRYTFHNSFLSAFTRHRFALANERLEDCYSLNLAFHINLLHNAFIARIESDRKTIREIRISRLHRFNGNSSTAPGEKFVLRFDIVTIDCPIYCILTGIFSKGNDGGERSNRHAQIPGRKSFECNPITTPAQSEIMLILVRYGIDWRRRRGRSSMYYWKETLWNGRRRVRDVDEWLSQGENDDVISKDAMYRW